MSSNTNVLVEPSKDSKKKAATTEEAPP
jgi:protein BCP1